MTRILVLLAGLLVVGSVYGASDSGTSWDSHHRIDYQNIICVYIQVGNGSEPPNIQCALSLAKDGAWGAHSAMTVDRAKAGALALCR